MRTLRADPVTLGADPDTLAPGSFAMNRMLAIAHSATGVPGTGQKSHPRQLVDRLHVARV